MNRMLVSIILFVVAVISYGATPEQKSESQKVFTNTNVVLSFKEDSDTDGYRWVYVASEDKNETKKYKVVKDSSRFLIQDKEDKFQYTQNKIAEYSSKRVAVQNCSISEECPVHCYDAFLVMDIFHGFPDEIVFPDWDR